MKKKLLIVFASLILAATAHSQDIKKLKITDVEEMISSSKDSLLVINFWATFCKPCVAEIPSFIRITEKYKDRGVKLLLISLDLPSYYPAKITAFAKAQHFNADIAWLNETNADYFCPKMDPKWSGSIPATLLIDKRTGYRKFFEEEMTGEEFETELHKAMGN